MPRKKYIVTLTDAERQHLETLSQTGKTAAYIINPCTDSTQSRYGTTGWQLV